MIAATYCPPLDEAPQPPSEGPLPAPVDIEPAVAIPAVREQAARSLDDLGLGRKSAAHLKELLSRSQGLIVITGSCGTGKDTTVRAAVSFVQRRVKNIVTIEKPAEPDGPAGAFAAAVRGLLPQDPDVIVIGDISAPETADLAVRAALSGVLVFATLDSQDSMKVADRLVDMGIDATRVASALIGVVSQRLVRIVCSDCRQPATYADGILAKAGLEAADGITFYRGRGCDRCNGTGFCGRTGVFEVLRIDPDIQELIRNRAGADAIREAAVRRSMRTQFDDVLAKALFGTTTFEEVLKTAGTLARRTRHLGA
jgi:type II secretory ATPase GspE/PulE/Tfp pilus assembly ATPase PilB-like protein